ncbi:hypothetical protein GUITHDRAFT_68158 [Guillardia theta CCMP2712]|uniref:FAD-binding domain-containing protein n=1 Tax=Guillardia theta (strain CCMP2712) TaxID=905079 RepID=L1JKR6_GUITC|nr:hypothetical protein GUITHDRAFT_68158 [Guillardia theta CCMP2712]EKX49108.1 hypothetical protein GUITHDRAFT_68158 [Guillardia theta CCMP2712]|eukprot:XP_005836088.1 hypothetical protein GUITHDRAFT_68158 [Guillardia theta CCMP2712]
MFAVQDRILTFGVSQSSQESPIEELKEQSVQYENSKPSKTVIVGVGPAGLATAIMLARRGWSNITIFDKLPRPPLSGSQEWGDPERSYNIGLDIKGQNALKTLEVWDRVEQHCADVKGRMDWIPGSKNPQRVDFIQKFGYSIKVIQRDCLAGCLLEEIQDKYADKISVHYNVECQQVQWSKNGHARLTMLDKTSIETPFLVGADGANSAVRSNLVESSKFDHGEEVEYVKYEDDNERVYKTISLEIPENFRDDLDYSAVCLDDIIIDALPLKGRRAIAVVLFRPNNQKILQAKTGKEVHDLFASYFPMFLPFLTAESCDAFARKPVHKLPTFQHCGPVIHRSNTTVMLGDAIHTVKPFFGFGINTALDDIFWLDRCLDSPTLRQSLVRFSEKRGHEAVAIVEISRALDRPGLTGLCNFFLPMLLDKLFEDLLPGVFAPNLLTYLRAPGVR